MGGRNKLNTIFGLISTEGDQGMKLMRQLPITRKTSKGRCDRFAIGTEMIAKKRIKIATSIKFMCAPYYLV